MRLTNSSKGTEAANLKAYRRRGLALACAYQDSDLAEEATEETCLCPGCEAQGQKVAETLGNLCGRRGLDL